MKKILFLLLSTIAMYGQVPADATPLENIQITNNVQDNSATKVTVQTNEGVQNWLPMVNLPVSTATTNALDLKTTLSAGAFSGFAVTDNGNGTINVASGIAYLRATNDQYAPLIKYPIAAYNNIPLADNTNNYVVVSYNGGSPALVLNTTGTGIDTQTNNIIVAVARVGSVVHFVNLTGSNSDPNAKIRNRYLQSEGISRATGLLISSTGLKIATTAGITYSGLIRLDVGAIDTNAGGTFTLAYNNGSTWTRTTGLTDINNTQYNNAGTLTTMTNNKYRTDYAYILVNSPSKLYVIMGNTEYNSLADAQAAPTPSILPVEIQVLGISVGRIIVQKSGTTLNTASPFITAFTGSTAQNHNDLAGIQGGTAGYYGHTSNIATAAAFTNYYGDVASSGIPQPKTLDNTRTEIVTTAAVNAAKPNIVTGTGTTNYVSKWTSSSTEGLSSIFDNGLDVGIGTATPQNFSGYKTLTIDGTNGGIINLRVGGTNSLRFYPQADGSYVAENRNLPLIFYTDGIEGMRLSASQELLIGTSVSNGNKLRVNGTGDVNTLKLNTTPATASGTPPVLTWNSTTKNVESVPYSTFLTSSNALLTTGNQSFTGVKSATSTNTTAAGVVMTNEYSAAASFLIDLVHSATANTNSSGALRINNNNTGTSTSALQMINQSTGFGGFFKNITTGIGVFNENWSSGVLYKLDSRTGSTGDLIQFTKNNSVTGKVDQNGEFTVPKMTSTGSVEAVKLNLSTTSGSQSVGNANMVGGTVTITTTAATTNSVIMLTRNSLGITGFLTYTTTNGSFTINSNVIGDAGVISYVIFN